MYLDVVNRWRGFACSRWEQHGDEPAKRTDYAEDCPEKWTTLGMSDGRADSAEDDEPEECQTRPDER
jgi:hypothetical protein